MDPLVRDLAMQVVTACPPEETATTSDDDAQDSSIPPLPVSTIALDLFHQSRQEGVVISREALLSVVHACEHDGQWQEALDILMTLFEEEGKGTESSTSRNVAPWVVRGSSLCIEERDRISSSLVSTADLISLGEVGDVLASVMRNCNSSSNFGLALFCLHLYELYLPASSEDLQNLLTTTMDPDHKIDVSIGRILSHIDNPQEALAASMVALCGLRCYQHAIDLYHSRTTSSNISAAMVFNHAVANNSRFGTSVLGNPWVSAYRHIDKLTTAVKLMRASYGGESELRSEDQKMMQDALARSMHCCTNAHQPALSLHLLQWFNDSALSSHKSGANTFDIGAFNDAVTAEIIMARRWTKDVMAGIGMFENVVAQNADGKLSEWRMTIAAGLTALIACGRGQDAIRIFQELDESALSTDSYTAMGRHLAKEKEWKPLIDMYRDATIQGYSSEELSMLAMTAVISTKVENRLRVLRAIVDECAANAGLDRENWMTTRYWHIKRELGFYHARLLMWWNDPDRAPLDELNLAIKEFQNELSNELRPKNDVVRTIVDGVALYDAMDLQNIEGYSRVPRTVSQWSTLIDEVLNATRDSPIRCDPNFIANVVMAYKILGCSRECVDYALDVMNMDGIRVRKSTLAEMLEAAKQESEFDLSNDIQMLLSRRKPQSSFISST